MPDDRMFHRRAMQSEKVTSLTDFEYRVWTTYLLCADDYGVMRFSAAALQAGCDALEHRKSRQLERAFRRIVDVGLLRVFEHQGKSYVFQADWQDWQGIRYPRQSVLPIPPDHMIAECTPKQRDLFTRNRGDVSDKSPQSFGEDPETSPTPARAGGCETANGKQLTANGSSPDHFDRFWACYPRKTGKEAARKAWAKLRPDDALVGRMLAALEWQARQPQWLKDGGQYIPHPATWLNQGRWQDEPHEQPQISERNVRSMGAIFGTN